MPGNEHNKKSCINSNTLRTLKFPDLYTAVFLINTCSLIACGTGIYAIIIVKVFAPCSFAARDDPPCFSLKFLPFSDKKHTQNNRDVFRCVKTFQVKSNDAASFYFCR